MDDASEAGLAVDVGCVRRRPYACDARATSIERIRMGRKCSVPAGSDNRGHAIV